MTRIVSIVDNRAGDGLVAEHGLSLLIEHGSERVLFDTGAGEALVPNAAALAIDLGSVTRVVLSHSHYDHTGGLARLRPECPVYAGGGVLAPSFSRQPGKPVHGLGMSEASRSVFAASGTVSVSGVEEIAEGVFLMGPIPRRDPMEHVRGFFYDETCTMPSRVPEELALLTDDGVLVTGCCHAGVVNTVECVRSLVPAVRIRAVVGGLHLCRSEDAEIARACGFLNSLALEDLTLLHCTGESACAWLKRDMDCPVRIGASGMRWSWSD